MLDKLKEALVTPGVYYAGPGHYYAIGSIIQCVLWKFYLFYCSYCFVLLAEDHVNFKQKLSVIYVQNDISVLQTQ